MLSQPAQLQIDQLSWRIANKAILSNISCRIDQGEIIGIIGPNGAGKTSLLRCILQQQQNITGSIYLNNKNINHYSRQQIAQHFSLVAQKNNAIFSLTVYDIIRMGLIPHKSLFSRDNDYDRAKINAALIKVELSHALERPYQSLSGGEQQRVLIARALVQEAKILLLDEATNHLDIYYQHQILSLVQKLNITVLMTLHNLDLAAQYCQRLLLLNQGQLIYDDTPEQVLCPERLEQIFRLPCERDQHPITNKVRVSFYHQRYKSSATYQGQQDA